MEKLETYLEKHKLVFGIVLVVLILLSGALLSWRLTAKKEAKVLVEKTGDSQELRDSKARVAELEAKVKELEATKTQTLTETSTSTSKSGGKVAGVSTTSGVVNINTASLSQLDTLPGVGPPTAQKIIDYRTANGGFQVIEDIMKVKGIKQATFGKLKDKISVN